MFLLLRQFISLDRGKTPFQKLGIDRFFDLFSVPPIFEIVVKLAPIGIVVEIVCYVDNVWLSVDGFGIIGTTEHVRLVPDAYVEWLLECLALLHLGLRRVRLVARLSLLFRRLASLRILLLD